VENIIYFDLDSANPLGVLFLTIPSPSNNSFSSSILFNISNASKIASFLVAAAFFNLSAANASSASYLIISSLATHNFFKKVT
jgi:hypothetical protein